jgi:glycosyltransferase involved in cell wall biosynthesis
MGIVCFLPEPNNINFGPTKLFEYMVCGLPVVASHFPEWRSVVEGSGCGVCVDPTDPEDIARGIQTLGRDRDRLRAMGLRGRAAVLDRYNWESESRRLLAAYSALLSG